MRNGPRNYEIIYEREERNPRATDYRKSILVYLKNTAFCIHIIYNAVIGWYIYVDFILVLFDSIVHFTTTFFFLDILCFFFLNFYQDLGTPIYVANAYFGGMCHCVIIGWDAAMMKRGRRHPSSSYHSFVRSFLCSLDCCVLLSLARNCVRDEMLVSSD